MERKAMNIVKNRKANRRVIFGKPKMSKPMYPVIPRTEQIISAEEKLQDLFSQKEKIDLQSTLMDSFHDFIVKAFTS